MVPVRCRRYLAIRGLASKRRLAKKVDALQSDLEAQNKLLAAIKDKKEFVF